MPIHTKQIKLTDAAKVCSYGKRSLERWLSVYRRHGEEALEPKSTRPRTNPKETPIFIKNKVIELRKEKCKCALKLKWELEKENVFIHHRTIGKILRKEGLTRKYRVKRIKYKYIKAMLKPGELIEIDVKYVPHKLDGRRYYQYTAIDCSSRWRFMAIYDSESNYHAIEFLKEVINRFPFKITGVKTDNHSTFTNRYAGYQKSIDPQKPRLHPFDIFCYANGIDHYLIDKGKPQQNGTVERSHRSDQESFYEQCEFGNTEELKYKTRLWNMYYNDLEHCGLGGKTPNEFLKNCIYSEPPNVCA